MKRMIRHYLAAVLAAAALLSAGLAAGPPGRERVHGLPRGQDDREDVARREDGAALRRPAGVPFLAPRDGVLRHLPRRREGAA